MATRVGVGVNFNNTVNLPNLENPPVWCKVLSHISHISRDIANFVLKLPNFRYHSNEGQSGLNYSDSVKLRDLENPLFGVSRVIANFVFKNNHLVTMITKVGLGQISTTPLNWPTQKPPIWCKHLSSIFNGVRVIAVQVSIGCNANFRILGKQRGKI